MYLYLNLRRCIVALGKEDMGFYIATAVLLYIDGVGYMSSVLDSRDIRRRTARRVIPRENLQITIYHCELTHTMNENADDRGMCTHPTERQQWWSFRGAYKK